METSLCDCNNTGEAQYTKGSVKQLSEVASHAGLGEEHSKKENSSYKSLDREEMEFA